MSNLRVKNGLYQWLSQEDSLSTTQMYKLTVDKKAAEKEYTLDIIISAEKYKTWYSFYGRHTEQDKLILAYHMYTD